MSGSRSKPPLWRKAVKLLVRLVRGASFAHAYAWTPGLSLAKPEGSEDIGEIVYRGRAVGGLLHPDVLTKRAGAEIFVIGSGPSVMQTRVADTDPSTAILLNGAMNLIGKEIGTPLAVAVEDERFVWRHFDLMRAKIDADTLCLFSVGVIRAICEIDRSWLADKRIILIDDIRKPCGARRRSTAELAGIACATLSDDGIAGFSDDPSVGVFQGGSVAISAIQFAAWCRPRTIGLFGIDISNADRPRFYEKAGDTAKSGIAGAEARIVGHVLLAHAICHRRGIELVNYSPVSALRGTAVGYDPRFAVTTG
ncbi:glycosyl transferase [Ciceribacter ferrooxidans]|uniref:glycosyl transferase n=1 Tax=Ciceribacter ferrooxidans TaxID=2509717 RepID=UPI001FE22974|nr:glycosyl transferase [Ciceribacter ferrooxidans]